MRTIEELIARKSIDRHNLEIEAADQPDLLYDAGVYLSRAKPASIRAKSRMEALEAEFAHNIKLEPKMFGLGIGEKVTDTLAKSLAKKQPEVEEALNAYLLAYRYELKIDALYKAMAARSSMLRMLNDLWQNNYYTDTIGNSPKPRTGRKELIDPAEQTEQPEMED